MQLLMQFLDVENHNKRIDNYHHMNTDIWPGYMVYHLWKHKQLKIAWSCNWSHMIHDTKLEAYLGKKNKQKNYYPII